MPETADTEGWTCCREERDKLAMGVLVREGLWEEVISQLGFEGWLGVLWTVKGVKGIACAEVGLA